MRDTNIAMPATVHSDEIRTIRVIAKPNAVAVAELDLGGLVHMMKMALSGNALNATKYFTVGNAFTNTKEMGNAGR
jgi:hypothetical protein